MAARDSKCPIPSMRMLLLGACQHTPAWGLAIAEPPFPDAVEGLPRKATSDLRAAVLGITGAVDDVKGNAEAAYERLSALRDSALSSGKDRDEVALAYDAFVAEIERVAMRKTTVLEAELVAMDAVLEHTETELAAVAREAADLPDADLTTAAPLLQGRLCTLFEALHRTPRGPVEESTLIVLPSRPGPDLTAAGLGCLLSELAPLESLSLLLPVSRRIRPGDTASITVRILPRPECGDALDLGAMADAVLLSRTSARANLILPDGSKQSQLIFVIERTQPVGALAAARVCFAIPPDAPLGSTVVIETIAVGHSPLGVGQGRRLPLSLAVSASVGVEAPLVLPKCGGDYQTPCVTADGRIIAPTNRSFLVFNAAGTMIADLPADQGWRAGAAAHDDSSDCLIVRNGDYITSLDLRTYAGGCASRDQAAHSVVQPGPAAAGVDAAIPGLRWSFKFRSAGGGPGSVVVLPDVGIAVFADKHHDASVVALRLSDGSVIQRVQGIHLPIYAAAGPPGSGTVYLSSERHGSVTAVQFDVADPCRPVIVSLVYEGNSLIAHGSSPLAVVPPGPGKKKWHLVVGRYHRSTIVVMELPTGDRVCEVDAPVPDADLRGLAADPGGGALLLSSMHDICTVPWPLEGMPELS